MAARRALRLFTSNAGPVTGGDGLSHPGAGERPDIQPARPPGGPSLAGRRVLVVDDEPMILEILVEHCASLGLTVYEAPDGEPALREIERHPEIEVLVTDVRMPGLDGPALAERALVLRPSLKVIFVTGYATHYSTAWPTLRKPFELDALDLALRQALLPPGQGG
ncbi:response regulator [Belnapia sp. F-4-1]|uniref:response regulator n=1 Tax=Belnapia sp. F-4-1 TaxID=1545443 RepID=UPI00068FC1B3|nr:response regulator [Belnapia sp. F-4-1]